MTRRMSAPEGPAGAHQSNRSRWICSAGTPASSAARRTASIHGSGPQTNTSWAAIAGTSWSRAVASERWAALSGSHDRREVTRRPAA